jgi:phospholipase C
MSFCGAIIRRITWLERQTQITVTKACRVEALQECADWDDEGYNRCVATRDDGYNKCSQTRDEGYRDCCDWWPCSWVCDAWVWVSNIVCVAWTWVSSIVCIAWQWVSKWVCRIINWVYTLICKFVVSVIFWFIRKVLEWTIFLPCRGSEPDLDERIKHIFVLVLENRSFDHMLGAIPIRGTDAETGRPTQTARRADDASNDVVDAAGNVTFHCTVGTGQKRSVAADPGHEFGNTLIALTGLAASASYPPYPSIDNSGFAQNFADVSPDDPCSVMLSYTREDVPIITALAEEFAVCDHWFSSMPGPTWPNRFFFHAASSAGLDDSPSSFDSGVDELISGVLFDNGTIYDLLDSENIDWAVYEGDHFPQVKALSGMDLATILTRFHDMADFEEDLADGSIPNYVFIEPDYGDDITGNTYKCGNSQHPLDDITHGERLVKRVYEAIRNSPVWEQSLLIITYDEGGGFFDHVRPGPTEAPGDSVTDPVNDHHDFDFTQLGVRVPAIVCSPWIPRNLIDHRVYEHASVPATVERLWDLPNMTDRDDHARALVDLLSLRSPRTDAPTSLPEAAEPEATCDDDEDVERVAGLVEARRPGGTLVDPVTRARARQRNSSAITSSSAGFLRVALRQDLLLAGFGERRAIFDQGRSFETMGEVGEYGGRVAARLDARQQLAAREPSQPAVRARRSRRRAHT